jgi:hypothetical protein
MCSFDDVHRINGFFWEDIGRMRWFKIRLIPMEGVIKSLGKHGVILGNR